MKMQSTMDNVRLMIDPHVHIYDCFPLTQFFDSAYANFSAQAHREKVEQFEGMLLLTESARIHWFDQLMVYADKHEPIRDEQGRMWRIHHTEEKSSLMAQSTQGKRLVIAAGRQIVTKEHLEVSALLTQTTFPDGAPLRETVEAIRNNGGFPVVPWGFGKWWGERGTVLSDFMQTQSTHNFFLGDNSGRPGFLPYPIQFKQARQQGVRILPGSDPLPISTEYRRVGSAGFSLTAQLSVHTPTEDLRHLLHNPYTAILPFHQTDSFCRFAKNFLALHLNTRQPP